MKSLLMRSIIAVMIAGFSLPCYSASKIVQSVKAAEAWYPLGEKVTIVYSLQNSGTETAVYNFRTGRQFDIWVTYGGVEVYRASRGMMYIQTYTSLSIAPGESKEFRVTWDQNDFRGRSVGAGVYTLHAQLDCTLEKPAEVSSRVWIREMNSAISMPIAVTVGQILQKPYEVMGKTVTVRGTLTQEEVQTGLPQRSGRKTPDVRYMLTDATGKIEITGITFEQPRKDAVISVTGKVCQYSSGTIYLMSVGSAPSSDKQMRQNPSPPVSSGSRPRSLK